jgi:hypothetical protein
VLIEEEVVGRELEIAMLGNSKPQCGAVGEIITGNEFYDYDSKYKGGGGTKLSIPAALDGEIIKQAVEETQNVIVLEDHLMYGGLASSVADYLVDNKIEPKTFKRMGIPQVYAGFGSGPEQRKKYGYDTAAIVEQVRKQL